jgi:hypothetical protein
MGRNLILTYIIFTILFIAAMFKILFPSPALKVFYLTVSLIELFLGAALLLYFDRWQTWALLTLVFATWGGYAFYTTVWDLPCSCLGSAILLPRGASFGLNLGMLGISCKLLKELPKRCHFGWLGALSLLLFGIGFLFANFFLEN